MYFRSVISSVDSLNPHLEEAKHDNEEEYLEEGEEDMRCQPICHFTKPQQENISSTTTSTMSRMSPPLALPVLKNKSTSV